MTRWDILKYIDRQAWWDMLWNEYERYLRSKGNSGSYIKWSKQKFDYGSAWLWERGWHSFRDVSPNDFREFFASLWDRVDRKEISPKTVEGYFRTFRALTNWLVKEGYIPRNPMEGVTIRKAPDEPIETYTDEEFYAILEWVKSRPGCSTNLRDYCLLRLLFDTGMRLTEATRLTSENLDLANRTAKVLGKGKRKRTVSFGKQTAASLSIHLAMINQSEWVFPSRYGTPLAKSTVWGMVKEGCLETGTPLRKELIHAIRHTAACNLLKIHRGDILLVKRTLGHSSVTTTMRYVEHLEGERILEKSREYESPADKLDLIRR